MLEMLVGGNFRVIEKIGKWQVDLNFLSSRTSDPPPGIDWNYNGDYRYTLNPKPRTLEPIWEDESPMEFLMYHERQNVTLAVFDANVLKQESYTAAELVARCTAPRWLTLAATVADAYGAKTEGSVQLRVSYVALSPEGSGKAKVLALHLGCDRSNGAFDLRLGDVEIQSRPCKALDPGNVHGFGKRITQQIQKLRKHAVDREVIAEVFGLTPEAVADVDRIQAANERPCFGWHEIWPESVHPDAADPNL
ncbi:hypothetical protein AK812_SmicGene5360 [Symbiodinium microadriaticum]|uniref:C2 domain-containing protein n=1 Tax=Symbiodinium microadriaticum TaxID=2951 RepID=A0A1Q9EU09_SYMMI|nr:hypothetical protein AK812_SmicGene5360 [Symbiodinium microadriaticum]